MAYIPEIDIYFAWSSVRHVKYCRTEFILDELARTHETPAQWCSPLTRNRQLPQGKCIMFLLALLVFLLVVSHFVVFLCFPLVNPHLFFAFVTLSPSVSSAARPGCRERRWHWSITLFSDWFNEEGRAHRKRETARKMEIRRENRLKARRFSTCGLSAQLDNTSLADFAASSV